MTIPARRRPPGLYVRDLQDYHIGVVATFGINDRLTLENLAWKLSSINMRPCLIAFSRYGEEVPPPPTEGVLPPKRDIETLELNLRERVSLDRFFCIMRLALLDEDTGEPVFAFVNVRLDRIRDLIQVGRSGEGFNLQDKATVVLHGNGEPNEEERTNMQNNYLYREDYINTRIFPPLSEVT